MLQRRVAFLKFAHVVAVGGVVAARVATRIVGTALGFELLQELFDFCVLCCRGGDKLFKNSLVIVRRRRYVVHESSEGLDEVICSYSDCWRNLDAPPVCSWPHGVSVLHNPMDGYGGVCRSEGICEGVGVADETLERLLCILEVGFPLFPGLVKSR